MLLCVVLNRITNSRAGRSSLRTVASSPTATPPAVVRNRASASNDMSTSSPHPQPTVPKHESSPLLKSTDSAIQRTQSPPIIATPSPPPSSPQSAPQSSHSNSVADARNQSSPLPKSRLGAAAATAASVAHPSPSPSSPPPPQSAVSPSSFVKSATPSAAVSTPLSSSPALSKQSRLDGS